MDADLGGEVQRAHPMQTIAIPKDAHHGFTVVGPEPAKLLIFFPETEAFTEKHTTYL